MILLYMIFILVAAFVGGFVGNIVSNMRRTGRWLIENAIKAGAFTTIFIGVPGMIIEIVLEHLI